MKEVEKIVVFVAAERDREGNHSPILDLVESQSNMALLHSAYNYTNEKGREVLKFLENKEPPQFEHPWENTMRQEFWAVQQSHIVVADLDNLVSLHLAAIAALYEKPVLAVSSTLASVPAYFSGAVGMVVKPEEALNSIVYMLMRYGIIAKKEPEKAPAGFTKEHIQDTIHQSLVKHMGGEQIPVN